MCTNPHTYLCTHSCICSQANHMHTLCLHTQKNKQRQILTQNSLGYITRNPLTPTGASEVCSDISCAIDEGRPVMVPQPQEPEQKVGVRLQHHARHSCPAAVSRKESATGSTLPQRWHQREFCQLSVFLRTKKSRGLDMVF